jgi:hypothetical protein
VEAGQNPRLIFRPEKKKYFRKKKINIVILLKTLSLLRVSHLYAFEWIRRHKEDLAKRRRKTEKVSKKKCLIEKELGRCG